MKNGSRIAAIALVSSFALFAAGCDRNKGPEGRTAGEKLDNAIADVKQKSSELGATVERKTEQAGKAIDDAAITTAVKSKYIADDTLKGLDISVGTEQGVVVLTGSVQSETARERATQIAQGVDGVVRVRNSLTIK